MPALVIRSLTSLLPPGEEFVLSSKTFMVNLFYLHVLSKKNPPILYGKAVLGTSELCDCFFLGQDFAIRAVSMEMVISCVFFLLSKALNLQLKRVPCNKLLTNLACQAILGNIGNCILQYYPCIREKGKKSFRFCHYGSCLG